MVCIYGVIPLLLFVTWVTFHFFWAKPNPPKIFGVYCQPGRFYWLKAIGFYLLIQFRKFSGGRFRGKGGQAQYGSKSKGSLEEMEKVQTLSSHFQAIDGVYFNGANSDGFQIVSGTARRPHGVVDGFLIFRIPGLGTFVSPKFPDALLFGGTEEHWGAEGFRNSVVVPMEHWTVSYNGNLKLVGEKDASRVYRVKLTGNWTSKLPHFDFDYMVPAWTMAKSIAKETWTREYFQSLVSAHQTHYEQFGDLNGEIEVDGTKFKFSMPSMRDHSYGVKRDWKLMHRYMMHMFSLEDGRRFNIGLASQPSTFSELDFGFVCDAHGSMATFEEVSPSLYFFGENGIPPTDYALHAKATNGINYFVQVQVLDSQEVFLGWEWEARLVIRRAKFIVDGVIGFGISECHYRNRLGRPEFHARGDPEWVKLKKPWISKN